MRNLTHRPDVNDILATLASEPQKILGNQLIGLYLTGSLTYGDFDPGSSDIDFLAILDRALSDRQRSRIEKLHSIMADDYPKWGQAYRRILHNQKDAHLETTSETTTTIHQWREVLESRSQIR